MNRVGEHYSVFEDALEIQEPWYIFHDELDHNKYTFPLHEQVCSVIITNCEGAVVQRENASLAVKRSGVRTPPAPFSYKKNPIYGILFLWIFF